MAFTIQNWGRASVSANEPLVTLASGTVVGSPSTYEYWTLDTQNTVATTANYFATVITDLSVGDRIAVYSSTDGTLVSYIVSTVTLPSTVSVLLSTATQIAQGTITNAQMLAGIYATPVQLIPAPGANRVIVVTNATISIVYATTQYQNGGAVILQYDNTVHGAGTNTCTGTLAAASVNGATANNFILLVGTTQAWGLNTALGNKGVFISCATGEFTNGDSPLKYSIQYRIASLA